MFLLPETTEGLVLFFLLMLSVFALWVGFLICLTINDDRRYLREQLRRRDEEQARRDRGERSRQHEKILVEMSRDRKESRHRHEEMMREIRLRR